MAHHDEIVGDGIPPEESWSKDAKLLRPVYDRRGNARFVENEPPNETLLVRPRGSAKGFRRDELLAAAEMTAPGKAPPPAPRMPWSGASVDSSAAGTKSTTAAASALTGKSAAVRPPQGKVPPLRKRARAQ